MQREEIGKRKKIYLDTRIETLFYYTLKYRAY